MKRALPILALALTATVSLVNAAGPSFGLGVLRRDGLLVPFATYNGRSWNANWPGPGSEVVFPISLADVPKPWWGAPGPTAAWTATLLGGSTTPLTLKKPELMRVFCTSQLGVRTGYEGGEFDPREPTVPKAGLAIAGDAKLLPVVQVSLFVKDAARMIDAITDDFNKEEALAEERFLNWSHPYGALTRKGYPIELEAFYRSRESTPSGEFVTNYIEAVRRFPASEADHDCGLITFVRGWVIEREGKTPIIDVGARITYCDRADVSFMLPFGRLLIDREPYWVYQISSWRDELYGVSRATPEAMRPVVAVAGGGCPKNAPVPGRGRGRGRGGMDAGRGVGG